MDIPAWVKKARLHAGLTQEEFGERFSVSKQNVSAWENGHHRPSFPQLSAIAETTGCALTDAEDFGLHMPLVSRADYDALPSAGKLFVQGAVANAIAIWRETHRTDLGVADAPASAVFSQSFATLLTNPNSVASIERSVEPIAKLRRGPRRPVSED